MKLKHTFVAAAAVLAAGAWLALPSAHADDAVGSGSQCSVTGLVEMPANLEVYNEATGGSAIARFTGSETALAASGFPGDGTKGRVAVQTGTGTGHFRIAGFVDATQVPIFTGQDIPVVSGHVWLASHRRVHFVAASPGKLRVELRMTEPMRQNFGAWAACGAFTLTQGTPSGWSPAGRERGYVAKKDRVDLYDDPGADRNVVTTLIRSAPNGILLWSKERRGAFVHVQYHGAVVLDAWARAQDLKALPPGETMDQMRGSVTHSNPPRLALQSSPKVVRTTKEIPIHMEAKEGSKVIGRVEAQTDTYVLDIVAGWASVMPKALDIAPAQDKQFWVKASELGL